MWEGPDPEPALNGVTINFVNVVGGPLPWTLQGIIGSTTPGEQVPYGTFTGGLIQITAPNTVFQFLNNNFNGAINQQTGPCYLIITQLQ
jgi:hypothetical protein